MRPFVLCEQCDGTGTVRGIKCGCAEEVTADLRRRQFGVIKGGKRPTRPADQKEMRGKTTRAFTIHVPRCY